MDSLSRAVAYVFVVTAMLSLGLEVSGHDLRAGLAARALVARSLFANFILIPALGLALAHAVPMRADSETGFLLLAFAPGGLSALQFASKGKGTSFRAGTVTLVLAASAVFVVPALARTLLPAEHLIAVPYARVLAHLLVFVLAPLVVGIAASRIRPRLAENAGRIVGLVATIVFVGLVLQSLSARRAAFAALHPGVIDAMIFFVLGSMAIGWLLGGPAVGTRTVLASTSSARNAALCLVIATTSFPHTDVDMTIVAFSALMLTANAVLVLLLSFRNRKRRSRHALSPARSPS